MAKLMTGILLLSIVIMQVYTMEIPTIDNSTDLDGNEGRLLLSSAIGRKCKAKLYTPSAAAPTLSVTLTRLANNKLYYFSPVVTMAFETARKFCDDHGMHLVTINSEAENTLVFAKVVELGLDVAPGAWIGYRDVSVTGTKNYQWVQANVGPTPTFFRNVFPDANQCAYFVAAVASWLTDDCSVGRSFVCELEPPCSLYV